MKKIVFFIFLIIISANIAFAHTDLEDKIIILITDDGFLPQDSKTLRGGSIYFKNIGKSQHWPVSELHPIDQVYAKLDPKKEIPPGEMWQFHYDTKGKLSFFDKLHPELMGTLEITEKTNSAFLTKGRFLSGFFTAIKNFFLGIKSQVAGLYSVFFRADPQNISDKSIEKHSKAIFYNDNSLYSYVEKFGPSDTLILAESIALPYDRHKFAKKVGEFSYKIFKNKSFQWHDSAISSEIMSGYFLGVITEYSLNRDLEDFSANLITITADDPMRAHVLGHSIMIWKNYELFDAIKICKLMNEKKNLADECMGGIFMENVKGGRSPETGSYSAYLNNDPEYPCNIVDATDKDTCYKFMPYRFTEMFMGNFEVISKKCEELPEKHHRSCFAIMGRHAIQHFKDDTEQAADTCNYAPNETTKRFCVFGAAKTLLWTADEKGIAVNFCKLISEPMEKEQCYQGIFGRAKEIFGAGDDYNGFCNSIEANFINACLKFTPKTSFY